MVCSQVYNPPTSPASAASSLRFGILGAAAIAPNALIQPAQSHPEVTVYAVAARDIKKAEAFAKKWGIEKVHGSYQGKHFQSCSRNLN